MLDPLDVLRIIFGSGVAGAAVYQLSKALRTVWVERSKRKTTLAILDRLTALEPEQIGRLYVWLDRVRPPPPDQIGPPAAS